MAELKKNSIFGSTSQKERYNPALSGYRNLFATGWPAQGRSILPGSGYSASTPVPPLVEPLSTELDEPLIAENNDNIIA